MSTSAVCVVQPSWDGSSEQHEARIHADTAATVTDGGGSHALRLTPLASESASASPLPAALLCPFVLDASVSPGTIVLPLATCALLQWALGTRVQLEAYADSPPTRRTAHAPPRATKAHLRVWKPSVGVQWKEEAATGAASTAAPASASAAPFFSTLLPDVVHEQMQSSGLLRVQSGSSSNNNSSSTEFRVLYWEGLACLAAVHALYAAPAAFAAGPLPPASAAASAVGSSVTSAYLDEDTEIECEVMTTPPIVYSARSMSSVEVASASSSSSPPARPSFPHLLRPIRPHGNRTSLEEVIAIEQCFPKEWSGINTFVHNAVQAHRASTSVASVAGPAAASAAVAAPFGLAWGVPRSLLLCGATGVGKSRLLECLETLSAPSGALLVRRIQAAKILKDSLATGGGAENKSEERNALQIYYANMLSKLAAQSSAAADAAAASSASSSSAAATPVTTAASAALPPRAGVLILEDLDVILCGGSSYQRLSTQLLALLERLSCPPRHPPGGAPPPPLVLLIATVKNLESVPAHFLSSGRFDAQIRVGLLQREQRTSILASRIHEATVEHVPLNLASMPPPPSATASHKVAPSTTAATLFPATSPLLALCASLGALTPGFVASDLSKLVQYALLHAARRWDLQQCSDSSNNNANSCGTTKASPAAVAPSSSQPPLDLRWSDFAAALSHTHPSGGGGSGSQTKFYAEGEDDGDDSADSDDEGKEGGARSVVQVAGRLAVDPWPSVGGYPLLKRRLGMTLHHWLHPSMVSVLGLRPISGVLFHGPSGAGKSLWAGCLARAAGFNFLSLSVAAVFSQWLGESENKIRNAFKQAAELAPCVLLLDQIECIAGKRDSAGGDGGDGGGGGGSGGGGGGASGVDARVLSTLLNELDGVGGRGRGVYVVACTRSLAALDAALLRPGRFDEVVEVTFPDTQDRLQILQVMTCRQQSSNEDEEKKRSSKTKTGVVTLAADVDLEAVARMSEGLTAADLRELLSSAGMETLRKDVNATAIGQAQLLSALWRMTHGE